MIIRGLKDATTVLIKPVNNDEHTGQCIQRPQSINGSDPSHGPQKLIANEINAAEDGPYEDESITSLRITSTGSGICSTTAGMSNASQTSWIRQRCSSPYLFCSVVATIYDWCPSGVAPGPGEGGLGEWSSCVEV